MKSETSNLLQSLDLDARPEIEPLYFSTDETRTSDQPSLGSEGMLIPQDSRVSFDSYFNAFFENYWFTYTALNSVRLELQLIGDCEVSLWRQTPDRDVYLLARQSVQGEATVQFEIDDDDELRVEAGRLWCEIETRSPTTLQCGGWYSDVEPVRKVALAAVFCTFNRQQYLHRTLRAIDEHETGIASVQRIFVINQGDSFTAEGIVGDASTGRVLSKLQVIEQPNMGGCGGFTRGMHETLLDDDLTHFVLMDDDIRVHPDSLVRVTSFLSYANDDVVVGGHMLNLHRPNFLFEAGAELHGTSLQPMPVNQGKDLSQSAGLEPFLHESPVEYNGWWFFAANKNVLREIGYPMPCFIRGDDIEYGMRLRRAGKLTIPVPGIAVWHEPFYLKLGGWQFFFEIRNRLVAAALHDDAGTWKGIRGDLRAVFARDIAMSRYHSSKLMIAGIETYLAGPESALITSDQPLRDALKIVAEHGPERLEHVTLGVVDHASTRPPGELRIMLNSVRSAIGRRFARAALAWQLVRRVLVTPEESISNEPRVSSADLVPYRAASQDAYVVVEQHGSSAWRYRRDTKLERELWQQFLPLLRRIGPDDRYRDDRAASGQFSEHWHEIFRDLNADPLGAVKA